MTRLTANDIHHIPQALSAYDNRVRQQTGSGLLGVACRAVGAAPSALAPILAGFDVAICPTTCGDGLLSGFSESLAAIACHLGCRARITDATDVAGLAEAWESGADVILSADDNRFVAIDTITRMVADNAQATGSGFAAALDLMAGGLAGQTVVVMGCGPVGISAARALIDFGAMVRISDPDAGKCRAVTQTPKLKNVRMISDRSELPRAIRDSGLVIEATNAAGTLSIDDCTPATLVAAPGIPLGPTPEAAVALERRLYHDPLETGTAVMLATLAAIRQRRNQR